MSGKAPRGYKNITITGTPYKEPRNPRDWTHNLDNAQQRATKAAQIQAKADRDKIYADIAAARTARIQREELESNKLIFEKKISDVFHYSKSDATMTWKFKKARAYLKRKIKETTGNIKEAAIFTLNAVDMHEELQMPWPLHKRSWAPQPSKI